MVSGGWLAAAAASDLQVAGPVVHVPVAPYLMPITALSLPALGSFTSMTHHIATPSSPGGVGVTALVCLAVWDAIA